MMGPLYQFCDSIVGNGKILVGAAGNEGSDSIYLGKTYTSSDTSLYSFIKFPYSSRGTNGIAVIDIWGNPNQDYIVAVNIYNTRTDEFEDWTPYIIASSNSTYLDTLYDDDFFFPDPCYVGIATSHNPLNNKNNVQVIIDHTAQDDNYRWAMIEVRAKSGQTKMWAAMENAIFTELNYLPPVAGGSTNSTIGEIGGTGNSIISVGAYNTTATTVGNIASFSSKGPTADGRTKPDITAPGNRVTASVSRFDNYFLSGGGGWSDVVSGVTNNTNNWFFAKMQGTSMASPMVTGILALWLEAYPHLTSSQAKQLLQDNALTDNYTGSIPTRGDNTWGWGKVDAHEGMLDLLTKIPSKPIINPSGNIAICQGQSIQLSAPNGYASYQWSNNTNTQNITVSTAGDYSVRVRNNQGYISPWSEPKRVLVHQNPPIPTINITGNVLSSSSTSDNQWYLNNSPIPGATQKNYLVEQNGDYHVVVTNANNCSSQSNKVHFSTVGIDKVEDFGVTKVYPNPTSDELNIEFSENSSKVKVELYDITGKLVKQYSLNSVASNRVKTLHLDDVTNGVYSLRILMNESQRIYKVVVTK